MKFKSLLISICFMFISMFAYAENHYEVQDIETIIDSYQPRWVGIGESTAEFNNYTDDVSVTDQGTIIEFTPSYVLDEQENGISATYRVSILATEFKRNIRDSRNIMHRFSARTLAPMVGLGIAKEFSIANDTEKLIIGTDLSFGLSYDEFEENGERTNYGLFDHRLHFIGGMNFISLVSLNEDTFVGLQHNMYYHTARIQYDGQPDSHYNLKNSSVFVVGMKM